MTLRDVPRLAATAMKCDETRVSSDWLDVHGRVLARGDTLSFTPARIRQLPATHGTSLEVMLRLHTDGGAANEKPATGSFQPGFECPVSTSMCRLRRSPAMLEPCIQGCV